MSVEWSISTAAVVAEPLGVDVDVDVDVDLGGETVAATDAAPTDFTTVDASASARKRLSVDTE